MSPAMAMPLIPLNLLVWIILIPIIILSSMVLATAMKRKIQPPYQAPPTSLDDLPRKE